MNRGNRQSTCFVIACLLWASVAFSAEIDAVKQAEQQREAAVAKVYGTVVCVYGENPADGGGSGVLIDPSGLALTNFHVVKEAGQTGWAGLADERLYRWRLIGVDPGGDLALIQLTGRDAFPYAPLGDSDQVRVGQQVMAMGNPFALAEDQTPSVSFGIVSGIHRYQEGEPGNLLVYGDCIQVDSSINPGNSGGPLFDMAGHVIGINGRGSFEERGRVNVGLGYAISSNQARHFLPELLATKIAQHATLDATFEDRDGGPVASAIDLDRCPLVKAGLQLGDRLIRFNGRDVTHANQLTRLLSTLPAGWPVRVEWERDGRQFSEKVTLNALDYGNGRGRSRNRPTPDKATPPADDAPARQQPGVIADAAANRELAMILVKRCDALKDQSITDAMLLGGKPWGDRVTLSMQLTENGQDRVVTLSDDLLSPKLIDTDEPASEPQKPPAAPQDATAVIVAAQRKCVKIFGAGIGREHGYATGLIVSADGLIVTASGVYLDGQRIRVVTSDGRTFMAEVVRRDATSQLALLKISAATPEFWDIGPQTIISPQPGDWVLAISNVFKVAEGAEPLSVTMGVVSLRATLDTKKRAQDFDVAGDVLLIDAVTANPGAPGGALIDLDGRLVGMIGKTLQAQATNTWLNYAMPLDRLVAFIHNDVPTVATPANSPDKSTEKPGELGIRIFKLSGRRAPAYIDGVVPDSPAAAAGLRKDDLVLSINDQWIRTVEEYEQAAKKLTAGQKILLTVKRDKQVVQVSLTAREEK